MSGQHDERHYESLLEEEHETAQQMKELVDKLNSIERLIKRDVGRGIKRGIQGTEVEAETQADAHPEQALGYAWRKLNKMETEMEWAVHAFEMLQQEVANEIHEITGEEPEPGDFEGVEMDENS